MFGYASQSVSQSVEPRSSIWRGTHHIVCSATNSSIVRNSFKWMVRVGVGWYLIINRDQPQDLFYDFKLMPNEWWLFCGGDFFHSSLQFWGTGWRRTSRILDWNVGEWMCDEESLRPLSLDPHNRKLNRITIFRAGGDMNIISLWEGKGSGAGEPSSAPAFYLLRVEWNCRE